MPDILNDSPSAFQAAIPDFPENSDDAELHTFAVESLGAINLYFNGHRAPSGLLSRSIIEDGAVTEDGVDNSPAVQITLDSVAAAGGGIVLVPPTPGTAFEIAAPLTIPHGVVLRGVSNQSRISPMTTAMTVFQFADGTHRGGIENLVIEPGVCVQPAIGMDLSGSQYLRIRHVRIRGCVTGLVLSDGISEPEEGRFSAYNVVENFEIDACESGIVARQHCNQSAVRDGRIHFARADDGSGVAINVDGAVALSIGQVAVENFDTGVRIRGRTSTSLRDVYYEADTPDSVVPGQWLDVDPALGSIVRFDNSHSEVSSTVQFGGSLEDAVTSDLRSHIFSGAKRHHAAAAERNLIENGDFHRADGTLVIPGWTIHQNPVVEEISHDFVSGSRSYDVTQSAHVDDAIRVSFIIAESTDYATVMIRYKNLSSAEPTIRLFCGVNVADVRDFQPPDTEQWRVLATTVEIDPAANGLVDVFIIADASAAGGRIRVDEAWAVIGATAAPSRSHGHRVEYLPDPITVVTRTGVNATQEFASTDITNLPGLGGCQRSTIGALLRLRGTTDEPPGALRQRVVRPFIRTEADEWNLDLMVRGLEQDRYVSIRGLSFVDGARFIGADTPNINYSIEVVGWILSS